MERVELSGVSIAGVETCIEVPGLRLLLDLGSCSRTAVSQQLVLVSHGHLDHIGAIAQHAARRKLPLRETVRPLLGQPRDIEASS